MQTHTYADRVDTVSKAKTAGLSPCSGLIAGLGETDEQLVEALFALRELDSDSIPVNFLMPFDGTPLREHLGAHPGPLPARSSRWRGSSAPTARSASPAAARCTCARLQGLALHVANSIFLGDYLTSEGQAAEADLELIRDNGFVVLGCRRARPPSPRPSHDPAKRRRGAGTAVAPNA